MSRKPVPRGTRNKILQALENAGIEGIERLKLAAIAGYKLTEEGELPEDIRMVLSRTNSEAITILVNGRYYLYAEGRQVQKRDGIKPPAPASVPTSTIEKRSRIIEVLEEAIAASEYLTKTKLCYRAKVDPDFLKRQPEWTASEVDPRLEKLRQCKPLPTRLADYPPELVQKAIDRLYLACDRGEKISCERFAHEVGISPDFYRVHLRKKVQELKQQLAAKQEAARQALISQTIASISGPTSRHAIIKELRQLGISEHYLRTSPYGWDQQLKTQISLFKNNANRH